MIIKPSKKLIVVVIILIGLGGWGLMRLDSKPQTGMQGGAVTVKAMQVVQQDTPINYAFVGKVASKNEVKIMSKVSGNIVEKMVSGGDTVYRGQSLFRVDNKQYLSAISSAQAALAKSQAALRNTQRDVERYRRLASVDGIARQTLDSYETQAEEEAAAVEENRAAVQRAMEDEQDTLIIAPVDGRIDVNDVSIGQFVTSGSTAMATVSSLDPIWVQFSMSENEYIKLTRLGQGNLPASFKDNLRLVLSDGSEYDLKGSIEQIDKGIGDTTGTIMIKASFSNPQKFLVPGMFAKIVVPAEVREGATLIVQRAVKELLDETFVTIVTADGKAESRKVMMGERVGNMWVVNEGLVPGDVVVVEGIDKVSKGTDLKITMITPEDLQTPAKQ